jgi:hypothetical protein
LEAAGAWDGGCHGLQLGGEVDPVGAELVALGGQVGDPFGAQRRRHGPGFEGLEVPGERCGCIPQLLLDAGQFGFDLGPFGGGPARPACSPASNRLRSR